MKFTAEVVEVTVFLVVSVMYLLASSEVTCLGGLWITAAVGDVEAVGDVVATAIYLNVDIPAHHRYHRFHGFATCAFNSVELVLCD
jgi:hypothetical protein